MSAEAKALNVGNVITIDGQPYELSYFTWEMHPQYERWLKDCAWKEVESEKQYLDPVTYKERHDAVTALICSGYFKRGGPGWIASLQTTEGQIYQHYLMLKPKNPDVTLEMVTAWRSTQYAVDMEARIREMEAEEKKRTQRQEMTETTDEKSPSSPCAPPLSASPGT